RHVADVDSDFHAEILGLARLRRSVLTRTLLRSVAKRMASPGPAPRRRQAPADVAPHASPQPAARPGGFVLCGADDADCGRSVGPCGRRPGRALLAVEPVLRVADRREAVVAAELRQPALFNA